MLPRLIALIILPLLAACATAPAPVTEQASMEPEPVAETTTIELPERPLPDESVYPLLVAEFALRRREYGVALDEYMTQAPELRDPGVSAHATHLAQFMRREPEALEAAQLWVELEPDNVEANNTLANLLVRRGRTLEAVPYVAAVARAGEDANFPVLLNGFRRLSPQEQADLVIAINDLAREFPDNGRLLLTQALIHEEMGQSDQALDKLDRIFKDDPYQQQAMLLESKLLLERGSRKPFARIERALEANPDDNRLRLQYARLLTQGDIDAARTQFEILSERAPRDSDILYSLALINREMGDSIAAKNYLKQLIELGERADDAHYYLGRIEEEDGNLSEALDHYARVGPGRDFLSANGRIGKILIEEGKLEQSQTHFAALRAANPEEREQLYAIEAELLGNAEYLDIALTLLNLGLSEYPESTTLRYSRSMVGEQRDDLALMESDLRYILEREPDNATALNALGYTLANRTTRYDEAYDLISKALELQPEEPAILDSMGWVLYRQGEYEQALVYLNKAFERFPDPEVAAHRGEVLWVSGDTEGALAIWRAALDDDPEHQILLSTLERLGVTALRDTP
mgnify:FL=1